MSEKGRGGIISPQTPHYASVRNNGVHVTVQYPNGVVTPTSLVCRDIDLPMVVETEESPSPACSDHDVKRGKERRLFLGGGAQRTPSPGNSAPERTSSILRPSASVQKGRLHPSTSMGTMSPDFSRFRTQALRDSPRGGLT